MHIVFVTEFFPRSEDGELRGGVEARSFYMARALSARHQMTILASFENGMERRSALFGGAATVVRCGPVRTFAQAGSLVSRLQFQWAVARELRARSADVVDAQSWVAYLPAWFGARHIRKRVLTVHDVWIDRWVRLFGPAGILGEVYERFVLHRPWSCIIANSDATASRVRAYTRRPVRVIYNGIDLVTFRALPEQRQAQPTMLYIGRLVAYKRVQDLLDALALVRARVPNAQLIIIGVGPYESTLRDRVRTLHLENAVHFLGHVPQHRAVLARLRASTLLCLPSVIEGFGMVTVEAMAAGVPFVNADIPVTREITAGHGGLFFPAGDARRLADQLCRVLTDPALRSKLGEDGRAWAARYDWPVIARQTEQCYREQ